MDSVMRRPRVLASRSAFTRLTVLVVICTPDAVTQQACAYHRCHPFVRVCSAACPAAPLVPQVGGTLQGLVRSAAQHALNTPGSRQVVRPSSHCASASEAASIATLRTGMLPGCPC